MANKKINQLVLKTTIQSTDLFPLGDASTGQLFKKTIAELQAAIGGAVISVNGLVGTVVLDTDDIQELATPTNRYFTDARARGAISLTVSGNSGASTYSSSTGVLNVPTYTLAGLGGITATFLSGTSGISYNSTTGVISYTGTVFTDASIRALFSAGTGISYNSSTGAITNSAPDQVVSISAGTGITVTGTYPSFTVAYSGTVYTDASVRGLLSGTAPITYNSSTGAIGITQASGSTNGFLSSTDWTTFNSKQSALTLGNVSEVNSNILMFPDGQNGKTIGNLTIQVVQAGSTTNGFLGTTDWNTFNNKQATITLTTTGTSGAATFTSNTLNIPQYQAVLTNPVTGTGTTNYVTKWTSSSAIGNSTIFDNGTSVGIGTATPSGKFNIVNNGVSLYSNQIFSNSSSTASLALGIGGSSVGATFLQNNAYLINSGNSSLIFGTNDTERMRISSAGNVGIGTSSPSGFTRTVCINSTTGSQGILFRLSDVDKGYLYTASDNLSIGSNSGALILNSNDTERMRITSGGNVGIGTTAPVSKFDVRCASSYVNIEGYIDTASYIVARISGGGTSVGAYTQYTDGNTYNFAIGTNTSGHFTFFNARYPANSGSELMRITSGGNILMGTTTDNGERLYVSGSIRATGSITANSDARLKKNIERIENALQKVSEISGYTYNTIYDEERHAGVIAQEIDKVLPEIVNKGNDGLMGVEYGNISALLIEAIKDLKVQNDSLLARLSALEK